jgi:predicted DNA-binding transcriptional regulator AlpA
VPGTCRPPPLHGQAPRLAREEKPFSIYLGFLDPSTIWVTNTVQYPDSLSIRGYRGWAPVAARMSTHTAACPAQADKMKRGPEYILPQSLPPRGLSREQAAAYIGVSPSLFDTLVKEGRMPTPKRINSRTVWDRLGLDAAFAALPSNDGSPNPWDDIAA